MPPLRIIQVSDTHLSRQKPYFNANWQAVVAHIEARQPDLVVHTGDVSLDGAGVGDDLVFSKECMDALSVPWLILPGNHDTGEAPGTSDQADIQPANEQRRQLWLDIFGPDYWAQEFGAWQLIGLDTQLFDTGQAAEAAQWDFFEDALKDAGARPVLLFLHKPFFLPGLEPENSPRRYLQGPSSQRLFDALEEHPVRGMASGHVHQALRMQLAGMEIVWAPTTAFLLNDEIQPKIGEKFCGLVEYTLSGNDMTIDFAHPDGIVDEDITQYPEAYGELREAARRLKQQPAP